MGKVKITFYGALARAISVKEAEVEALTIRETFNKLIIKYGEHLKERFYDEAGNPRKFINIYVNGRDIRFLAFLDTKLKQGDDVSIIPAVSGG